MDKTIGTRVKIFDTPKKLAEEFAKEFKKITDDVILKNGKINIAISGGNTPKLVLSVLAKDYKNKIQWSKVNLYWVDERCVPQDSFESNYGMTKEILLTNILIPNTNIHRIIGENEPEKEAQRYSELLKESIPMKNDFPRFDLIILGMGEDSHTASIFPNQMNLLTSDKICDVAIHPVSGQKRITLTGKVINNSQRIVFLVVGKSKAEVVKEILEKEDGSDKYPAAHIEPVEGELKWCLDAKAASCLIEQ